MQATSSAGNGVSIVALRAMGRVNRRSKHRVPVASQNGDFVTTKIKKKKQYKNVHSLNGRLTT